MHLLISKKLIAGLALVTAIAISYPTSLNATTIPGTPAPVAVLAAKIIDPPVGGGASQVLVVREPDALDIWLAKLSYQESKGQTHLKILDVNGLYSYGCLQFQEGTFRNYALKYGFISRTEPIDQKIYDCELQKKIAKLMLAEDYSNWRAWYTSVTKSSVGMPPK